MKDQTRLQMFIEKAVDVAEPGVAAEARRKGVLESVDKGLAELALMGYMPFTLDPAKQARYRAFLEWRAGRVENEPGFPPHFSTRDVEMEVQEFAKSATMFKPLGGMMASRFTSASSPANAKVDATPTPLKPPKTVRTKLVFKPEKLLCKRFQVPNPYPTKKGEPAPKPVNVNEKEAVNEATMDGLKSMVEVFVGACGEGGKEEGGRGGPDTEDVYRDEPVRPSMDIFKEIFAEEEEEEDEDEKEQRRLPTDAAPPPKRPPPTSSVQILLGGDEDGEGDWREAVVVGGKRGGRERKRRKRVRMGGGEGGEKEGLGLPPLGGGEGVGEGGEKEGPDLPPLGVGVGVGEGGEKEGPDLPPLGVGEGERVGEGDGGSGGEKGVEAGVGKSGGGGVAKGRRRPTAADFF
ncbi:hypothetical protein HDU67_007603 [Dinochytrium kinnereticum]|nr:hypothetical protein HDU67_007603 [Dinochytrium kinnereticum]